MDDRISLEELKELFPSEIPLVIVKLLFPERSEPMTPDELRLLIVAYHQTWVKQK